MLRSLVCLWLTCTAINVFSQSTFQYTYGNLNGNQANSLEITSDGGYVIAGWYDVEGPLTAQLYVIRLNSSGDTLWAKTYGEKRDTSVKHGSGNLGYEVKETFDGGFIVLGDIHGFGAGNADVYVVKINALGDTLWTKTYGGLDNDYGQSIVQNPDSGFSICGMTETYGEGLRDIYFIRTDKFGDTLFIKTYGGNSLEGLFRIKTTSDGNLVMVGNTYSDGAGGSDVLLMKVSLSSQILWSKVYGGSLNDFGHDVVETNDLGFAIVGSTESYGADSDNVYVIKTNSNGVVQWSKAYGGDSFDRGNSIVQTDDLGYVVGGFTRSYGAGAEDVFALKLDASGDTIWTKTYGGIYMDVAQIVRQTADKGFVFAGYTHSFGAGSSDVYFIKTDSTGNAGCHHQYGTKIEYGNASSSEASAVMTVGSGGTQANGKTIVGNTVSTRTSVCDFFYGISENDSEKIRVYPNPVIDMLNIEGLETKFTASIFNIEGTLVYEFQNNTSINLKGLDPGMYFILIMENSGKQSSIKIQKL